MQKKKKLIWLSTTLLEIVFVKKIGKFEKKKLVGDGQFRFRCQTLLYRFN